MSLGSLECRQWGPKTIRVIHISQDTPLGITADIESSRDHVCLGLGTAVRCADVGRPLRAANPVVHRRTKKT